MSSMRWPARPDGDGMGENGQHMVEQLSVIRLMNVLLSRRRVIVTTAVVALSATLIVAVVAPRSYSSTVSFLPQDRSPSLADLTGVVPPAGLVLPGFSDQSSAFYADLLQSEELLRRAVLADYDVVDDVTGGGARLGGARTLVEIFEIASDDPEAGVERAVQRLRKAISTRTNRETGVIRYTVTTRSPELSRQIADLLMRLINEFDLERRRAQASAERRFLAARLDSVRADARSAENRLAGFLERNRNFRNSPQLVFDHDRLQRDVAFHHQLLTSLAEAFERARIMEVRNTPVLTVMDHARARRLPDPRHLPMKGALAALAGIVIGIGTALWMEFVARSKVVEPEAYDEFVNLQRETLSGVRGLLPRRRKGE